MKFSDLKLPDKIKDTLTNNNFINMTNIQKESLPVILKGKDAIIHSQTGSGKTLVYLLPIIKEVINNNKNSVIIVPTRELCYQIKDLLDLFNLECNIFIGGTELGFSEIKGNIFIGTPGRLFEFAKEKQEIFKNIKYLVLDEADKLLSFGFESKIQQIVSLTNSTRQTLFCSATITDNLMKLSKKTLNNPSIIKIDEEIPNNLLIQYIIVKPADKLSLLFSLIKNQKCIVFFSTCNQVDYFSALLNENMPNLIINKIHGKMKQEDRLLVYNKFEKEEGVLLCTDVAARGIDFKNIKLVIHFDIPKEYTNIVHRSGRTARNNNSGKAILFVMENELKYLEFLKIKKLEIEKLEKDFELINIKTNDQILSINAKAFVAYIRSYKEHIINYILYYKELDFNGLVSLFSLIKIPNMKELRTIKFDGFDQPKVKKFKLKKK